MVVAAIPSAVLLISTFHLLMSIRESYFPHPPGRFIEFDLADERGADGETVEEIDHPADTVNTLETNQIDSSTSTNSVSIHIDSTIHALSTSKSRSSRREKFYYYWSKVKAVTRNSSIHPPPPPTRPCTVIFESGLWFLLKITVQLCCPHVPRGSRCNANSTNSASLHSATIVVATVKTLDRHVWIAKVWHRPLAYPPSTSPHLNPHLRHHSIRQPACMSFYDGLAFHLRILL